MSPVTVSALSILQTAVILQFFHHKMRQLVSYQHILFLMESIRVLEDTDTQIHQVY